MMTAAITNPLLQAVSPALKSALTSQAVDNKTENKAATEGLSKDFEAHLKALIAPSGGNQVSEEDLFAALIGDQIATLKGQGPADDYKKQLDQYIAASTRPDGYYNAEEAANKALNSMVELGHLTQEEAKDIKSKSFAAAQLDNNKSTLYDRWGGGSDPTIAVAEISVALAKAKQALEAIASGELDPKSFKDDGSAGGSQQITPQGNHIDGPGGGFLFKPVADHSKKLVVLLPAEYTNKVAEVLLKDADGNLVETGRGSGVANGGREHFRFNRAGADYPQNIIVEVKLASGETLTYDIPDPSQRYD